MANPAGESTGRQARGASAAAAAILFLWSASGSAAAASSAGSATSGDLTPLSQIAQMSQYKAAGIHECTSPRGVKYTCMVNGSFSDCAEAVSTLQNRDCCTSRQGFSTRFTLSFCIPDISSR